jgi:hypothetical protein
MLVLVGRILNDAQGVDPQVPLTKLLAERHGVSNGGWDFETVETAVDFKASDVLAVKLGEVFLSPNVAQSNVSAFQRRQGNTATAKINDTGVELQILVQVGPHVFSHHSTERGLALGLFGGLTSVQPPQ